MGGRAEGPAGVAGRVVFGLWVGLGLGPVGWAVLG
ncbi:hypothetical protein BMG523Draft_03376, partial [Frankia sp. BMG5.23]